MTLHDPDLRFAPPAPPPRETGARSLAAATALPVCVAILLALDLAGFVPPPVAERLLPLRQSGLLGAILAAVVLDSGAAASWWRTTSARRSGITWSSVILLAGPVLAASMALSSIAEGAAPAAILPGACVTLASLAVFAAFPLLIAERLIAAVALSVVPGRAALGRLAALPIAYLLAAAAACLANAAGLPALHPLALLMAAFVAVAACELVLRQMLSLTQNSSTPASLDLLSLRLLDLRHTGPRQWARALTSRFGLDFARSWALRYSRRAALPVGVVLAALCVLLTGLVRVDTTERGIYQRLGRPVAVLQPGLHLLLPWPLGQVRRVENGVIHAVPISFGDADTSPDASLVTALAPTGPSTAEAPPPISANRLWESSQPSDVTYLIASDENRGAALPGAIPGTQQRHGGFELISVSLRVLYRIGLDPASGRRAAYAVADPETLVRMAASRLLARHLSTRTLQQVLVEDRGGMALSLGAALQAMLDRLDTGIEVLDIAVEAAHPPAGAAVAYRQVQAAEIGARTAVSLERGRAETTAGLAARDAATAQDSADAASAEGVARAQVLLTSMQADRDAYRASAGAFVLERRLAAWRQVLSSGAADIIDPRLDGATPPTLDLRQPDRPPVLPGAKQGNTP